MFTDVPVRSVLTFALAATLVTGCATVSYQADPAEIAVLEQAVARSPRDTDAAVRLGTAYFAADRFQDARSTLGSAVENGATQGAAFLYLGLAHEELEDWTAARVAYDQYLATGMDGGVKRDIRARIALITRKELRQEARVALQQEQILSDQPPAANTVAVLPFRLTGLPEELQPLQTALADMIITDLGLTPLRSLERVRVQSMIDEMVLAQAGFTTAESGARMGRLLKAEHVVQGVLSGTDQQIVVDASVLDIGAGATRDEVNRSGAVEAIFDLEKQVVFDILDALNIAITASEREAITSNRTGSLVAFLAYGQGLDAMDRGDYGTALSRFEQASQIDPGFGAAQAQQAEAERLATASLATPAQIGLVGVAEIGVPAPGDMAMDIANAVNPSPIEMLPSQQTGDNARDRQTAQDRSPVTEQQTTSTTTQAARAKVIIVIPRPGGTQ